MSEKKYVKTSEYTKLLKELERSFALALGLEGDDLRQAVNNRIETMGVAIDPEEQVRELRDALRTNMERVHGWARRFGLDGDCSVKTIQSIYELTGEKVGSNGHKPQEGWRSFDPARIAVDLARAIVRDDSIRYDAIPQWVHDVAAVKSTSLAGAALSGAAGSLRRLVFHAVGIGV